MGQEGGAWVDRAWAGTRLHRAAPQAAPPWRSPAACPARQRFLSPTHPHNAPGSRQAVILVPRPGTGPGSRVRLPPAALTASAVLNTSCLGGGVGGGGVVEWWMWPEGCGWGWAVEQCVGGHTHTPRCSGGRSEGGRGTSRGPHPAPSYLRGDGHLRVGAALAVLGPAVVVRLLAEHVVGGWVGGQWGALNEVATRAQGGGRRRARRASGGVRRSSCSCSRPGPRGRVPLALLLRFLHLTPRPRTSSKTVDDSSGP